MVVPAAAVDPATLELGKEIMGWENGASVTPGQTFGYTLELSCNNSGIGGCLDAVLMDPIPEGLILDGDASSISVTGRGVASKVTIEAPQTVRIDLLSPIDGGIGMPHGTTITAVVPVRVDPNLGPSANGIPLLNTATATASNAPSVTDDFTVVPEVPIVLDSTASKSFDPTSGLAAAGTKTTLLAAATNGSNVPVSAMTITDPATPGDGAFTHLALTGDLALELPEGADAARVDAYVDGAWVEGIVGPLPAALPAAVSPAAVKGIRITYVATDGPGIAPGARATATVDLVSRATIGTVTTIDNVLATTVTDGDTTSPPVTTSATYTPISASLPLQATKTFAPDAITAGGSSTVALTATNSSDRVLDTLTITEPGTDPGPLAGSLTFTDWADGTQWPNGATSLTVTYVVDSDGELLEVTETASQPNSMPAVPSTGRVVGFTATYTGPMVAGAVAKVNFTVRSADDQADESVTTPNDIVATSTAPGGYAGKATAEDDLTTYRPRLEVEVGKAISPASIIGLAGEDVVVRLTGHVLPFPQSTINADSVLIADPANLDDDQWYTAFAPTRIASTPVPTNATLTVQYYDGTDWLDVPTMVGLSGGVHTIDFPDDVRRDARGIRFVYSGDEGIIPDTTLAPNLGFELRRDLTEPLTVTNCAAATAAADGVSGASDRLSDCPSIEISSSSPGTGGEPVSIEKNWSSTTIPQRLSERATVNLDWATHRSNLGQVIISDGASPSVATLPSSAFNAFDLVEIAAIRPAQDPLIAYDQVARVELYSRTADAWVRKSGDPCPTACDGRLPTIQLTDAERADTIGVRLVMQESPTRAATIANQPEAPAVGSGVSRSAAGEHRRVSLVFQLRDELRVSSSGDPEPVVYYSQLSGGRGVVNNDSAIQGWTDPTGDPVARDTDDASITVTNVPPTVTLAKTWTGGPLAVPAQGTAFPAKWPTARLKLVATNTTPARVDQLLVEEPVGGTVPFDMFNAARIAVTSPSGSGVTGIITLHRGTETADYTPQQVALLTEAELSDVTGLTARWNGRIDRGAVATIEITTRLRETNRSTGERIQTGTTSANTARATVSDLIAYDQDRYPLVSATQGAAASISTVGEQISVAVTKQVTPDTQHEPDRSPVRVSLTGQPTGPSRSDELHVIDSDPRFWNAFDFTQFEPIVFASPIGQVRVDVLVDATLEESNGDVVRDGGRWVTVFETSTDNQTPTLPGDIDRSSVLGIRYVFTKTDGSIIENPANPKQPAVFQATRRTQLRTGGPVQTTMQGNEAAPGETEAGVFSNTATAETWGPSVASEDRLHAVESTTAQVTYEHARNNVEVKKTTPSSSASADAPVPYTLTFTNTGQVPIVDPVITDRFPVDAQGPQLIVDPEDDPEAVYAFALRGAAPDPASGPAMPTALADVDLTATPEGLTFRFAEGTVLEVGQTYTITTNLWFRPGLSADTRVVNTTGISGERPWDSCSGVLAGRECTADTGVRVLRSGALRGLKTVRAVDTELGVLDTRATGCTPDADGFYSGGCTPITKPGGDEVWRMTWTNIGNLPLDRVTALDQLPDIGDRGVLTNTPRGSTWRPIPKQVTFAGAKLGTVSSIRVKWSDNPKLCGNDLNATSDCTNNNWKSVAEEATPSNGWTVNLPAEAKGLMFEFELNDQLLAPLGTIVVDVTSTTPAQAPTREANPIAWNNIAQSARAKDGTTGLQVRRNEANKVGVTLAVAPVTIVKRVTGEAAAFAPSEFDLTLDCTSVDTPVDLGEDGTVRVTSGEPTTVDYIPWGSSCTVTEDADASGATGFSATTTVVDRRPPIPAAAIEALNRYDLSSLMVSKSVLVAATDQSSTPLDHGSFDFTVECSFLGKPVAASGFEAGKPMRFSLGDGESKELTGLPAGAACSVSEAEPRNLDEVTHKWTAEGHEPVSGTGVAEGTLVPGDNGAAFSNSFLTSSLKLTKLITGSGADRYGQGEFTLAVSCVDGDRSVWKGDVTLGGEHGLTHTIDGLWADATCTVEETRTGGATETTIAPEGAFQLTPGEETTATITNTFDTGAVTVTKALDGNGADLIDPLNEYEVDLVCVADVDGEDIDVPIPGGARAKLSAATSLTHTFGDLPIGARCSLTETANGGAVNTTITPESVTVGAEPAEISVTNTFTEASLTVTKTVEQPALDAAGTAIDHGSFPFTATCSFQGRPVVAEGFEAGAPMSFQLGHGESKTLTRMPTGTACEIVEGEAPHVGAITTAWATGTATGTGEGPTVAATLAADTEAGTANRVDFVNEMRTSQLTINKLVTGPGAERYSTDAFTVAAVCVDGEGRTVWDGTIPFGGDHGLTAELDRLWADATCTLTEPITGGATTVTFSPAETTQLNPDEPATVTVTNAFEVGSVEVTKLIDGEGAAFLHPETEFQVQLACEATVDGEKVRVDLANEGVRSLSLASGLSTTYEGLPVGATCALTEPVNGGARATSIEPAEVTVGADAAAITVTNTFDAATLDLSKVVTASALQADGSPVDHGPFTFTVACTYLDRPVVAEGFAVGESMRVQLNDGESRRLTGLVAGTSCSVSEDDVDNLESVTTTWTTAGEATEADGPSASATLVADVEGSGNAVEFRNAFRTSQLSLTKLVEGDGADRYSTDAFVVDVSCVDPADRVVWQSQVPFGGEHGYTTSFDHLWADATCTITEPVTGGATSVAFSDSGVVTLNADEPTEVSITNRFDTGAVEATKVIDGPGADTVSDDTEFEVQLVCSVDVDGETVDLDLPDGGLAKLSRGKGLTSAWEGLPLGAACSLTETETGGAASSVVTPERVIVGQDATFTVTNSFDAETPEPQPTPATPAPSPNPSTPPAKGGPESNTGAEAGGRSAALLIGALLAASAATVALVLRRRSRSV